MSSIYIEDYIPVIKHNGLQTAKAVDFSSAASVALPAAATLGSASVLTLPTISGGLTATGAVANDFSGSTGAFTTSSGTNTLSGNVSVADGKTVAFGTTTGSKIGTATTQKIAFYNSTPVVQPAGTAELLTSIKALGLIGAGATPITVPGLLTLSDVDVALGTTTGSKIGTATTQKLGFYNATPVVQPTSTGSVATTDAGATTTVYVGTTFTGGVGTTPYTLSDVIAHLKTLGLIAA